MSHVTYFEGKKTAKNLEISTRPFLWFLQKKGKDVAVLLLIRHPRLIEVIKNHLIQTPNTFVLGTHYYYVVI